jgi:putative addiction module component (TIGR02574 family)
MNNCTQAYSSFMATLTKADIAALSVDQRLALIDDLWESIEAPDQSLAPPDWHGEALDQILDEQQRTPQPTISWSELRAGLVQKWIS